MADEITKENMHIHLGYMCKKIDGLNKEMYKKFEGLNKKLDKDYTTRNEFDPIKKIVYGVVMLILAGVVAGIMRIL